MSHKTRYVGVAGFPQVQVFVSYCDPNSGGPKGPPKSICFELDEDTSKLAKTWRMTTAVAPNSWVEVTDT